MVQNILLRQKPKALPKGPENSNLIKGYCKVCFYGDSLSKKNSNGKVFCSRDKNSHRNRRQMLARKVLCGKTVYKVQEKKYFSDTLHIIKKEHDKVNY